MYLVRQCSQTEERTGLHWTPLPMYSMMLRRRRGKWHTRKTSTMQIRMMVRLLLALLFLCADVRKGKKSCMPS